MPFLAQINLADVVGQTDLPLPRTGHLYFFYDIVGQPWGYDPHHREGFRLLYSRDHGLVPREEPAGTATLPAHRITTHRITTSPDNEYGHRFSGHHQIGGWPWVIQQDDMAGEASIVSRGGSCGGAPDYEPPPLTLEWRNAHLVLQCY